jgi:hypothetical protein
LGGSPAVMKGNPIVVLKDDELTVILEKVEIDP